MEDGHSAMYTRAIAHGLSDGLARSLRGEIRAFKAYYREQREVGAAEALRGLGGGFIPNDIS